MENSNFNRISATGLKSVEIDELNTSQIIINNEGLQYFHKYNILLPTVSEGFYNLQDELDNIMISNTTSDAEIIQLQSGLTTAQGNITTLGAGLTATSATAIAALNLANQKQFIIFFQPPLRCDISTNLYLDYDTNYFMIDSSNNLTLKNYWKRDISNNLYYTGTKVGIGLSNPNYPLEVGGNLNLNAGDLYRSGVPLSSTLSNFLPLSGGLLTGVLTGTTISATSFSGSGTGLTSLNASNISSGTLTVSRGGIGTTTLTSGQVLIGNATNALLQSANLTWNNTTNTLSATNFVGNGSQLTNLNASNITTGTLTVNGSGLSSLNASNVTSGVLTISQGGTGSTTLTSGQILIGNGTSSLIQSANLTWDNINNRLGIGITNPQDVIDLNGRLRITNGILVTTANFCGSNSFYEFIRFCRNGFTRDVSIGYDISGNKFGIGTTGGGTPDPDEHIILDRSGGPIKTYIYGSVGIGTSNPLAILDVSGNINSSGIFSGSGSGLTALNASNITSGTLTISRGGTGSTTLTSGQILIGNGTNPINQTSNLSFDTSNNRLGICISQPNYTLDVSGNINSNNNISAISFIENSVSLTNKYVKKYGFSFLTATPIAIINTPYFKYDINLNNYTNIINFDGLVPTRKFRIMTWLKSGYHEVSPTSNLDYEIIMSNPGNPGTNGGQAGLNIQAYSYTDSKNYKLDKTSSTGQFILRNSFNYLSYISIVQNTNIACIIIDYF